MRVARGRGNMGERVNGGGKFGERKRRRRIS